MNTYEWSWNLHRLAIDRIGWQQPFGKKPGWKKMLFISENDPICHMQFFPFWHYRTDLARRFRIEVRELPLAKFLADKNTYQNVDAVCFQTWFDLTPEAVRDIAVRLLASFPEAKLAYFDWFAPTHIRYAEALDEHIAVYVKKQVLKDRSQYDIAIRGDTNLTDYFAQRFNLQGYAPTRTVLPSTFWEKFWLAPHFAFSPHMLPLFQRKFPVESRNIDLHSRIAVKGTEWYTRMRQEALDKTLALEGRIHVVCRGRVDRDAYFRELYQSKICFSPFGYGEICWRDFEAMFTGSLLLKPDMSHIDCYPEAFLPNETYVPLAWDLSDFEGKIMYYLKHEDQREAITRRAFNYLAEYFREHRFLKDMEPLLEHLKILD
jgi:hypothetical protein